MAEQRGQRLMMMAGQYAPIASGVPYQPDFGFEGTPLGDYPMLGMFMQPVLSSMMGKMGMAPMGLNDRNAFDVLANQRFFRQQQELQRRIAEQDRVSWMATLRGVAHMTGTPWGADQMRAARGLTDAAVNMSPMLSMMAPDIMDEMAGYRGSAAVMAGRMMMAGRYRMDPVTGKMGQDPAQVAAQAEKLFQDLYVNGNLRDMQGISAGQLGTMYEQLSQRGLLGGSTRTPYETIRGLARTDTKMFDDALQRIGVAKGTDPGRLSGSQLDQLSMDTSVSDKLRAFDGEKVKKSLQGYLHAVNAVKDIFGDLGRPNAPMSELIGALEAMTNGSLGQIQPGQLNMMVRMTHQLAQSTGVGTDNAMAMQEHLSQRAARMGLEPVFAVGANQGGMAFGAAYRSQGLEPAWGRMNPDQMTQLDGQLRLNAAASKAAQRAGLAIRLSERLGFDPNSDAGRYIAALKSAQDTGFDFWTDSAGKQRSLNLGQAEFSQLMTGTGKVDAGQLNVMMNQKFANREFVQQYGLGDVVRRSQLKRDVQPWVGSQLQGFLMGQLRQAGVGDAEARAAAAQAASAAAAEIMGMDPADFANSDARTKKMGEILSKHLGQTTAGKAMGGKLDGFSRATGESFYGFWSEVVRLSPDFNYLGNAQNMFNAFNERTTAAGTRLQTTERLNAAQRTALAPLNRGSMVRRAFGFLQGVTAGEDANLAKLVATAIGGVDEKEVADKVMPVFKKIKEEQVWLEDQARKINNETDPAAKAKLIEAYHERVKTLKNHVDTAMDTLGKMGVSDEVLGRADTTRALNTIANGTAQEAGAASSDVALKLLSSSASVKRFGVEGVEHAKTVMDANRQLLQLAAIHTGGRVDKLTAEGLASLPEAQRKEVLKQVEQLTGRRTDAIRSLYDMQGKAGKPLEGEAADKAQRLADEAMRLENIKPQDLAREFLSRYGVTPADDQLLSDADREQLQKIGGHLKSEAGQALFAGLTSGQDLLTKIAETGGLKGTRGIEKVDALYAEYRKLLQTPEADRSGAEKAFREKFKLTSGDEYAQFQKAMQLQIESGFIRFGESGVGQRTEFSLAKAEDMLGRKLQTGQVNPSDRPVRVEFPNGMTINGRLKIDGTLDAKTDGPSTPGANHANTGGN